MQTLEEAFDDFAAGSILEAPDSVRRAMKVAYYMGAAHCYRHFVNSARGHDPEAIFRLLDELDFFMTTLANSDDDNFGHA